MTAAVAALAARGRARERSATLWPRLAPTLVAAVLAAVYLIVNPASEDLAAHLLRAKLFSATGFGLWNNWWYAGQPTLGYSVLFPAIAALLTPQVAGALAAVATAAVFEVLVRAHFGPRAWLGALWFGVATAVDLYTGRLTFAFGLLPAVGCALALQRRRDGLAIALALLTALTSPVAALFAAVAGAATAVGRAAGASPARCGAASARALAVAAAALAPILIVAALFPQGGREPYAPSALWPILLIAAITFVALPRGELTLRAGILLFAAGNLAAFLLTTPVGSNASRLAPLLAGPLAALIWWPRRRVLLVAAALPLLYLQWQAPIRDVRTTWHEPATGGAYYAPLLHYLNGRRGEPFRVEIPFTALHWEAYQVAPSFPLARGWERQADIATNPLFYDGRLTPAAYERWLHRMAVRYVAVTGGPVDYSATAERVLIDRGLPFLTLVWRGGDWRVYEVRGATPLATGAARATALGPTSVTLRFAAAGSALVRVRFTPYWAVGDGHGCVAPAGEFTRVSARGPGTVRLTVDFALDRIGARSPRCSR